MSKLKDLLSRRTPKPVEEPQTVQEEAIPSKYTRSWANRVAFHQGFELSDNDKKVDGILAALERKGGQCPCGGNGAQFRCPCTIMRTEGICKCGLFKTIEERKISSTSSAKIKINDE